MRIDLRSVGLLLAFAGCSNVAPLTYTRAPQAGLASATVSAVSVVDRRGEPDPTWYGAIRGAYANPIKTLHTATPVNVTVRDAFIAALAARGVMLDQRVKAPSVSVTIAEFQADRVARSGMKIRFDIAVADAAGRQVYQHETLADPVTGSAWGVGGVFADPKDLQELAQATMNQAIDEAVDAPAFQEVVWSP